MGKMAEAQHKLLEQMMGAEAMGGKVEHLDWWSEKVCRNFLFGACPHVLFGNTKMDLGPCPKTHSEKILEQFREAQAANPNDPRFAAYKQQHENHLLGLIDDVDRRIRASQRKLEKTPEENRKTIDLMREIGEIELSIQGGTDEIEALGEAGKVEESMEKLAAVDALKQLKADKERELQNLNENAGASGHQKLRVCETCGAMLSVLDSDKRLADHFGGKMHLGYHEIRQVLAKLGEERMLARNGYGGGAPQQAQPPPNAPSAPSGPRGSNVFAPPPPQLTPAKNEAVPHTPLGPRVPPPEEMPAVGHGDKVKREAGELVEDIKEERAREYDQERSRDSRERDRPRESRYRDREGESRDGERERHRERNRDRDGEDKYERSSKYDDRDRRDHDRKRERSRSPAKRRLV
ncbi:hypothetical protein BCR39DRAFT_566030 [Naematelia encephala]|uniref:LUC7-domain-containing protein n=1 Tax=Naematelia encephala TaxID=71784 RepID=A0A1Y2AUP2_9TREE|nr:hypothetical protein BCR39DRAFT_566030 [Naematelia encephala]